MPVYRAVLLKGNNLSDVTAATARNNLAAAQRLAATPVKTGNYTAVIGDLVLCDATAGGFAVTLPTTPVVGAKVNVKKLDATTNAVTVTCGGSDLIITGASTTSATASIAVAETREFVFDGTSRWIVAAGQTPQSTLDARYAQTANNLSDVTAATARTNLGLGSSATHPASDFGDTNSNTATSVDNELALFSSTTGKLLKRATGTGIPLLTSGVLGLAAAGTDYGMPVQVSSYTPGSYTWTEPTGAKAIDVVLVAGGGGGGAGRRGAAATVRCGGGGGGGGGMASATLLPSGAGTVVTVVVGAAGVGGTAQTVDNTDGASGTAGADTTLSQGGSVFIEARAGGAGGGGTSTAGPSGAAGSGIIGGSAGGAAAGAGGTGASGSAAAGAGGGGAGGGITSADSPSAGGQGGGSVILAVGRGGTAGAVNTAGGAGQGGSRTGIGGPGGGGGGGSITGSSGAGGVGSLGGGGGGGGGATLNGSNSGAGGAGAAGFALIVVRF